MSQQYGHTLADQLLPEEILKARIESGLSLRQVTAKTGLARDTVNGIERGTRVPWPQTLHTLAEAYEVPVSRFLKSREEMEASPKASAPPPEQVQEEQRRTSVEGEELQRPLTDDEVRWLAPLRVFFNYFRGRARYWMESLHDKDALAFANLMTALVFEEGVEREIEEVIKTAEVLYKRSVNHKEAGLISDELYWRHLEELQELIARAGDAFRLVKWRMDEVWKAGTQKVLAEEQLREMHREWVRVHDENERKLARFELELYEADEQRQNVRQESRAQ